MISTTTRRRIAVTTLTSSLVITAPALSDEIFVPGDQPTIQAAIDVARNGDEIIVSAGTYAERIDLLGKRLDVRSVDGPGVTTIDGESLGTVVTCDSGEGVATIIRGFTITNGQRDGGSGGGMRIVNSSPTVFDCVFESNTAVGGSGGAIAIDNGDPTIRGCIFIGNVADGGSGGGVATLNAASPLIEDCAFEGNNANGGSGGGIASRGSSTPTIERCVFDSNMAQSGSGGGIACRDDSAPVIINALLYDGSAPSGSGGGIANRDRSIATFINCTIANNTEGGAINRNDAQPTFVNCIVWGNSPDAIRVEDNAIVTVTYSNVEGGFPGAGNIDADPAFANASGNDFHLDGGSPCIDAADNTSIPSDVTTDLDGAARFVDDPATPDTGIGDPPLADMGAYEFGASAFRLEISGACDATVDVTITGATPNGAVAIAAANGTGSIPIPNGRPCAGTVTGLNQTAQLVTVARADDQGIVMISGRGRCGVFVQAIDLGSCATSNVEAL